MSFLWIRTINLFNKEKRLTIFSNWSDAWRFKVHSWWRGNRTVQWLILISITLVKEIVQCYFRCHYWNLEEVTTQAVYGLHREKKYTRFWRREKGILLQIIKLVFVYCADKGSPIYKDKCTIHRMELLYMGLVLLVNKSNQLIQQRNGVHSL